MLQEKDEEIEALNEHLKEVESNLSQAKIHVREYRERCEKAEVQIYQVKMVLKAENLCTTSSR